MKKAIVRTLLLTVVASAAVGGGGYWWQHRFEQTTDNAYVHADITSIAPKIAAYVAAVEVADNQSVQAGDVLVRLDDRDFKLRVEQAQAAVAAAQAALDVNARQVEAQQTAIAAAQAGLATWHAELTYANREFARTNSLVREDAASHQKQDATRASSQKAQAGLAQAEAQLASAKSQIAVLNAQRTAAEAQLAQAQSALELAQSDLAHTVIVAPVAGVVGNRGVRVGQYVSPGSFLLAVVPLELSWIEANYKETQITQMRIGQTASIAVDAYPGQTIQGKVVSLSPASGAQFSLLPPQNATGNFTKVVQRIPVKIEVDRQQTLPGPLRPGLSVVVTVDTQSLGAEARR